MNKQLLLTASFSFALSFVFAQHTAIPKLVLAKGETYTVGPSNTLSVDTLIMHDKSMIVFAPEAQGMLKAKVAIIGDKCTISSKGKNGASSNVGVPPLRAQERRTIENTGMVLANGEVVNPDPMDHGTRGQDGGHLVLEMHFDRLGSLIIDSRGGRGGNGTNGKNGKRGTPDREQTRKVLGANGQYVTESFLVLGQKGTDGSDATAGIAGGHGGNIDLTYSTNDFIPVFNNAKSKHRITLLHTAGETGRDGIPGLGGNRSVDGRVVRAPLAESKDGELKLSNAKAKSDMQY